MRLYRAKKGLPYPLGVLLSKSLLQPQEPIRNSMTPAEKARVRALFANFPPY